MVTDIICVNNLLTLIVLKLIDNLLYVESAEYFKGNKL